MKLKNTIILGLVLISTNTLSDGKWLEWSESSMINLDKVTSISSKVFFQNRCDNGASLTFEEFVETYRRGSPYHGGFYTEDDPKTADVTRYETYEYSHKLYVSKNPKSMAGLEGILSHKDFATWVRRGFDARYDVWSDYGLNQVFGFKSHYANLEASYVSKIVLGDQIIWLSKGLCGDGKITSNESANESVQDNLDEIRDFLNDEDDTYMKLGD